MRKQLLAALHFLIIILLGSLSLAAEVAMTTEERRATEKFQGINFGLGVGVVGIPSNRLAKNARVVNGTVRVEDQANLTASVILESHYFITEDRIFGDHPHYGFGPFVAIRSGGTDNQVIDAIGLGLMFGGRYKKDALSSWNLGVGLAINPSAQVLGDGITKNQPLPPGEEIRFQQRSLLGFMVLASFSWNTFE